MDDPTWTGHDWLNPPAEWSVEHGRLVVTTRPDSDFWRLTHEGFVKDDGHFFGRSVAGEFQARLRFSGHPVDQYDQAGLMVRAGPEHWMKCGVELSDGELLASVVVTHGRSDWSMLKLATRPSAVSIEVTRERDALLVRLEEPLGEVLRIAPWADEQPVRVGPMCASPKGPGFTVAFEEFSVTTLGPG
jgi:regulation of enolase protein 1 (concanavalin A-like superfamily)